MSAITEPIILDKTGMGIRDAILQVAGAINPNVGTVYGFHIDGPDAVVPNRVTYLKDAVGMTPAYMDYSTGKFNYGSWGSAFFLPRVCMVRSNGTVDYYLNPDDYTKKEDGTASDVANTSYDGNVMIEWGRNGRKIWQKIQPDVNNSVNIFISDYKVDSTYHAWSFINNQGMEVDHFYTPSYNGSLIDNKLRSISGQTPMNSKTASQEITYATANNQGSNVLWYTEVFADIQLINFLLILMGKSTDTQAVFGQGYTTGGSSASSLMVSGTLNDKGLFWGANDTSHAVKVFGMEHWWGNIWRRYAGHMLVSGSQKIKLTYTTADGSSASSYNITGEGYINEGATPTGTSGNYIKTMNFSANAMLPLDATGSSTTYYCDGLWFNNSATTYAYRGGACGDGAKCGAFCVFLNYGSGSTSWDFGASLSLKPLA